MKWLRASTTRAFCGRREGRPLGPSLVAGNALRTFERQEQSRRPLHGTVVLVFSLVVHGGSPLHGTVEFV